MTEHPSCAICGDQAWETIGIREHEASDVHEAVPYVKRRMRVLFEIWFPKATKVVIAYLLCNRCGFVCYAPRPDTRDLDDKYRFLCALEEPDRESADDLVRSRELFRAVRKMMKGTSSNTRVLDFGGGDGRLMRSFLERGAQCSVVDYTKHTIDGVAYLGASVDDIPQDQVFELVVCSHVLEHVADPVSILDKLRKHVSKQGGGVFVEVPMEIWGGPPIQEEPVTHVNFFTPGTLRLLLENCGYEVSECRLAGSAQSDGRRQLVIRATGRPAVGRPRGQFANSSEQTHKFLNLNFGLRIWRYVLMPDRIAGAIGYRLKRMTRGLDRYLDRRDRRR